MEASLGQSTTKKVLVSRFDRETLAGFVNPQSYLRSDGVELLSTGGALFIVPFPEIRSVSFVRDFGDGELRKERRLFNGRPKLEGLWIRMWFRDGEVMDGVLSSDLLQWEPMGFNVVPPDSGYQNQRVFVPRTALSEILVLGVVGARLNTRPRKKSVKEQLDLGLEMFGQAETPAENKEK